MHNSEVKKKVKTVTFKLFLPEGSSLTEQKSMCYCDVKTIVKKFFFFK